MASSLNDALGSGDVQDDDTLLDIFPASNATHLAVYDQANDKFWFASIADMKVLLAPAGPLPVPVAPTFTNFQDTNAGGSVVLVPAPNTVAADYVYRIGANGLDQPVPTNGVITVGNIDGSVYAYLPANGQHAQGATATSPVFTSYSAPLPTPTISFPTIGNKTVGGLPSLLNASSTNAVTPITYTSSNQAVLEVRLDPGGWVAEPLSAGTATVTAYQVAGNGYNAASPVGQAVTVSGTPVAPTYPTVLSASAPSDPAGECTLAIADTYPDLTFQFTANPGGDSTPKNMAGYIGSLFAFSLDFPATYTSASTPFRVDTGGHIYTGTFADGNVTLTLFS